MVVTRIGGPDIEALKAQALEEVAANIGIAASSADVARLMAQGFFQAAMMDASQRHRKLYIPSSLASSTQETRDTEVLRILELHRARIAAVFMEIGIKSETADELAQFITDQSIVLDHAN